jgi:hypothetical protein
MPGKALVLVRGGGRGGSRQWRRASRALIASFDGGRRGSPGVDGGRWGSSVWGELAKARQHRATPLVLRSFSEVGSRLAARGVLCRQLAMPALFSSRMLIIRLSRMIEECKRGDDRRGDSAACGMGWPRGGDATYARQGVGADANTACAVTPRGALRAQAVLSARTRPRFLPRDLARADEENDKAPETSKGLLFNREIREKPIRRRDSVVGRRRPG